MTPFALRATAVTNKNPCRGLPPSSPAGPQQVKCVLLSLLCLTACGASRSGSESAVSSFAKWDCSSDKERMSAVAEACARRDGLRFTAWADVSCNAVTRRVAVLSDARSGLEFVLVPGGATTIGQPGVDGVSSSGASTVLDAFLMSRTELTNSNLERALGSQAGSRGAPSLPAIVRTWAKAQRFAESVGCLLPTEAEWEHACRGGTRSRYFWGDEFSTSRAFAWNAYVEGGFSAVATLRPNAAGLYDMSGNANEWCRDGAGPLDGDLGRNWCARESTDTGMRVVRGGGIPDAKLDPTARGNRVPWGQAWGCGKRFIQLGEFGDDTGVRLVIEWSR